MSCCHDVLSPPYTQSLTTPQFVLLLAWVVADAWCAVYTCCVNDTCPSSSYFLHVQSPCSTVVGVQELCNWDPSGAPLSFHAPPSPHAHTELNYASVRLTSCMYSHHLQHCCWRAGAVQPGPERRAPPAARGPGGGAVGGPH